jgi:FkbM family methyltransferase
VLPTTPFHAVETTPSDGASYWSVTDENAPHGAVDEYLRSRRTRQYAINLACFLNWAHTLGHDLETAASELPDFLRRLNAILTQPRADRDWPFHSPERVEHVLATTRDFYAHLVERGLVSPRILRHTRHVHDFRTAGVTSFAQNGEDLEIAAYIGRRAATYIDVGCLWPIRLSISYFFYRYGGCGLCIDPSPTVAEAFQRARPRDIFLNEGVAAAPGTMTYYTYQNPAHNTSSIERAHQHERSVALSEDEGRRSTGTVEVPVTTLDEAVDRSGLLDRCNGQLDFLSIDVAGSGLEVLAGFSFDVLRPRLVIVEHLRSDADRHIPADELESVAALREHGYSLAGYRGLNLYLLDDRR